MFFFVFFTTSSPWLSSSSSRFSRSSSLSFTTCQHTSQTTISFTAKSGLKLLAWVQLCSSASAVLIKSATWVAAQVTNHRGIPGSGNRIGIEIGNFDQENHFGLVSRSKLTWQMLMLAKHKWSPLHPFKMSAEWTGFEAKVGANKNSFKTLGIPNRTLWWWCQSLFGSSKNFLRSLLDCLHGCKMQSQVW